MRRQELGLPTGFVAQLISQENNNVPSPRNATTNRSKPPTQHSRQARCEAYRLDSLTYLYTIFFHDIYYLLVSTVERSSHFFSFCNCSTNINCESIANDYHFNGFLKLQKSVTAFMLDAYPPFYSKLERMNLSNADCRKTSEIN